jgi:hypothetical protein
VGAARELAFDRDHRAFGPVGGDERGSIVCPLESSKLQWPLASIGSVLGRCDS